MNLYKNIHITLKLTIVFYFREAESIHASSAQSIARQVQSPAERRKDIVAQAMQEQKIFEDSVPKQEPIVKQEPGVSQAQASTSGAVSSNNGTPSTTSETTSTSVDTKPVVTASKSAPTITPQQRRPYQRSSTYNRQQVMPRLQVI